MKDAPYQLVLMASCPKLSLTLRLPHMTLGEHIRTWREERGVGLRRFTDFGAFSVRQGYERLCPTPLLLADALSIFIC